MKTLILFTHALLAIPLFGAGLKITDLTCEHQVNPSALHAETPRLSWRLESSERGTRQKAYRILAASSMQALARNEGELWDTGKKVSASNLLVFYKGQEKLAPGQQVFWKVQVWDERDQQSPWSNPAHFTMGLPGKEDWAADWISFEDRSPLLGNPAELSLPAPRYYRKPFDSGGKVVRARLHGSALGVLELYLNGNRIGDSLMEPGWTDYPTSAHYVSHDVGSLLLEGPNCLGAIVADGWYAGYMGLAKRKRMGPSGTGRNIYGKTPSLLVQLHLEYADGTSRIVSTDPTWKVATGPEYEADPFLGEAYDASRELGNWSQPQYDDSGWVEAVKATANKPLKAPFLDGKGRQIREVGFVEPRIMQGRGTAPIRIVEERRPVTVSESRPEFYLFDFGQNFTGGVRLRAAGLKKGQKLTIRYGVTEEDFTGDSSRSSRATDTYLCRGEGVETWAPRFTLHTFRFAEVEGLSQKPAVDLLTGLVAHSDVRRTSGFECSDELVNSIYQNCVWTQRASWIGLPSSSEKLNERMGALGPVQLSARAACYHLDNAAFLREWFGQMRAGRDKGGYYRRYAPFPFATGRVSHGAGFSDAGIHAVFDHWWMYGDVEVVKENWNAMQKYLQARYDAYRALRGRAFGISEGDVMHYNDPTSTRFIDLAMLALNFRLMAEMSRVAGNPINHLSYNRTFGELQADFRKLFVKEDGSLKVRSQTAHVLALRYGLLTDSSKTKVTSDLLALLAAKETAETSGVTSGALGTKSLLPVLTWTGNHDTALKILQTSKFPSWGYGVKQGDTTLQRGWGPAGRKGAPGAAGLNQSFSAVSGWLMAKLAGIDTTIPGFQRIRLEPWIPQSQPEGSQGTPISWVKAHYDSVRGRIQVQWNRLEGGGLLYVFTIPVQTTATVRLPMGPASKLLVDGKAPGADNRFPGGFIQTDKKEKITLNVIQSGTYRIEVK